MSDFPVPAEAFDDRFAIVGTTGSGKTYAAGTIVERVLQTKGRVVIIDPLGVWYGLRLRPDGITPSQFNPIIFGGRHGDLPITEHSGGIIGETVAGMAESCIVDLTGLGTKNGERKFMLAFLTSLYRKANGEPVHLVMDEADMFAPQRLDDKEGEAAKLLGIVETIVRRGRIKGFIPWLITQRPAVLNKNVLSQADALVAMKLTGEHDRMAIKGWIEGNADPAMAKEVLGSLASKQQGQGLVWIPGRGILDHAAFPMKTTFDSSRTPKRGEKKSTATLKPIDLGSLKERLSSIEIETKANDPKALKEEVARLKIEIAKGVKTGLTAADVNAAYLRGLEEGEKRAVRLAVDAAREAIKVLEPIAKMQVKTAAPVVIKPLEVKPRIIPKDDGLDLSGPQRKILASLAFWKSIGHESPSRQQVALIASYSPTSTSFTNPLGNLKAREMVTYPTPGFVSLIVDWEASVADPKGALFSVLPGPQTKIINAILQGDASREIIAERSDYSATSTSFTNPLGNLKSLGLVTYPSPGHVAMTAWAAEVLK